MEGMVLPSSTSDLSQRILLLSDIHANWPALEAVLSQAAGAYDAIWFLGDIVGYGPFPIECVTFVKEHLAHSPWRAGNHDLGLLGRMENFRWAGVAAYTLARHREVMQAEPDLWEWMEDTITHDHCGPLSVSIGKAQQVLTHANLENDLETYLFPANTEKTRSNVVRLREHLPVQEDVGWLLAGHSHVPCLFYLSPQESDYTKAQACSILWGEPIPVDKGHYYINPGSVGQPRDGDPRAAYVILDVEALTATWYRSEYNRETVKQRIYEIYDRKYRRQLLQMLEEGGTAATVSELFPVYQRVANGLLAG